VLLSFFYHQAGHSNLRQKIHHVQRLKEEVGKLSQDNAKLSMDLRRASALLRDHHVPFVAAVTLPAPPPHNHTTGSSASAESAPAASTGEAPSEAQPPATTPAKAPIEAKAAPGAGASTQAPAAVAAKENNGSNRYFFATATPRSKGSGSTTASKHEKTPTAKSLAAGRKSQAGRSSRVRKPLGAV